MSDMRTTEIPLFEAKAGIEEMAKNNLS